MKEVHNACLQDRFPQKVSLLLLLSRKSSWWPHCCCPGNQTHNLDSSHRPNMTTEANLFILFLCFWLVRGFFSSAKKLIYQCNTHSVIKAQQTTSWTEEQRSKEQRWQNLTIYKRWLLLGLICPARVCVS